MKGIILFAAIILQLAATQTAYSQRAYGPRQHFAPLGDFLLENGKLIHDCKIGYRTYGKLNATQSNAVIYPTAGATTTGLMELFGIGEDVDTTRFYLILIDALGNGTSSSPSNSTSQPKALFPQFTIRDMVYTQYKLLTEQLGIHHLAAVIGNSMAGCQALQWAVSFPNFMDKVISIEGTPKATTYDLLWMDTYIQAVKSDPAYKNGNYTVNPAIPLAARLSQLLITTPATVNKTVTTDSFPKWLASVDRNTFIDCNDFLLQVKAVMMQDISARVGGTLEDAAKLIKAKLLIIANKQDNLINQSLSIKFAGMANAQLIVMDSDLGHLVFNEKIVVDAERKFLSE
ncbi:MAG TPA: alpha/beta fold hydrolase [Chitinophagaceae bacterium]|nr:alpha/beta fold hydrolase [Chitinophagaceae bacterium]